MINPTITVAETGRVNNLVVDAITAITVALMGAMTFMIFAAV